MLEQKERRLPEPNEKKKKIIIKPEFTCGYMFYLHFTNYRHIYVENPGCYNDNTVG